MNVEWKLEKAEFAEFNLPTCDNIASHQLCRERQPLWKSHHGLNWTCLDQCHGVRFHGTNCPTVYSLNLILSLHLHTFTSVFSTNLLYVGLPRKAFPGKQAKVDTGHQCFSVVAQAMFQDSPKASPMAIFKWKNLIGQLNPLLEWMLNESWRRLSLLSLTCQLFFHIAVWQLCREGQPLWKSHDGLNLTCLHQCHGVRSLGTSSSQGWRKIIVIRHSKHDPWVYTRCFQQTCFM